MTRILTGRDALRRLDGVIAETRQAMADAISANDAADTRRAEVRDEQVEAFRALADIRIDLLQRKPGLGRLDQLHQRADDLLQQQDTFVDRIADALAESQAGLLELERQRAHLAETLDNAVETYEARVAEIEAKLSETPAYRDLLTEVETKASVVSRAEQKLELARSDRRDKGAPYQADALFTYLWERKFRTPDYKAGPLIRFLDGWVARLCGYDQAYLNYARLTELPERLGEHVTRVTGEYDTSVGALEAAEAKALTEGGADALKAKADQIRADLDGMEPKIEAAEAEHLDLAEAHEQALANGAGPAQQARHLLEEGLKAASFPDLRILAAETLELDDDRIVDGLVKLRAEEMSLELEAERNLRLPQRRRKELETLERLRRRFKRERLDSPYATFKASSIDSVLRSLLRGDVDADRALRQLGRAVRRRSTRTPQGFGGHRRRETLGLPDVLGDVVWEIAKEAGRSKRYGSSPWSSGSTRRRAPPRSFPRRSKGGSSRPRKKGGFRTGGGF